MAADKKEKRIWMAVLAVVLLAQLITLIYYGNRKTGYHEDELYTYYSTNKTAGLFVNDRQWMERDELRNDFVVLEGEQYRYGVVKQMQSWDVHPPLYYYIFHTVCSLFPGVFSKWLGLLVNLIAYVLSYGLLAGVVYLAGDAGRKGRILSVLVSTGWGFSAAVVSGVMFIRMYQWLTVFVLLCLFLHLRAMRKQSFGVGGFLLPMAGTVFLGFLTQYYYLIFHFFLGAGFCIYLLRKKKIKVLFSYVLYCAVGFGAAVLYYPAALSHIFRGYRGTEAVSEFSNASNTIERLRFFYGLLDDYVFHDTLSIFILVILLLAVTAGYFRKKKAQEQKIWTAPVGLTAFAAAGYFFTVSKTALLLGETSNRYQLPVYGILIFLLVYLLWSYGEALWQKAEKLLVIQNIAGAALLVLFLGIDVSALADGRVFFLYEEQKDVKEYIHENSQLPMVVFYHEASKDHIWWLSDELMEFDRVYLASEENKELITDEEIATADELLVYAADHENQQEMLEGLLKVNEKLTTFEEIFHREAWTLYVLR